MSAGDGSVASGEIVLPSGDLALDLAFFTETLRFRLDMIFPADDPEVATLSGHGLRLRLDRRVVGGPAVLRLTCADPEGFSAGRREMTAPNGVRIQIVEAGPPLETPRTEHAFVVHRLEDGDPWVRGRAGLRYRDLIPGRLGGAVIASHIRIPDAGPVPDLVHFHDVSFQLIYCVRGWVRLVYEDQGPPFVLKKGDCVIQPPRIRHRVLESSENLEVIEVSAPARHLTTMDHDMELPTPTLNPEREFSGQKFCRSESAKATWAAGRRPGFEERETGIGIASSGVASVRVARPVGASPHVWTAHKADIFFTFVLSGALTLHSDETDETKERALGAGDAFVIPPGMKTAISGCSADLELLEVALPAGFETATEAKAAVRS